MTTQFLLGSRFGYPISSVLADENSSHDTRTSFLLPLSRFIATIASSESYYFKFNLLNSCYLGCSMSNSLPFLLLIKKEVGVGVGVGGIEEEEEEADSVSKLKLFFIDKILTSLFSNQLELLGKEIEQKANYELQNSTCSETLNNEDNLDHCDVFEVFEEHFIRPLLEMPSITSLWTSPLTNTFNDLTHNSTTSSHRFNLSLFITSPSDSSSSTPHTCIPVIGTSLLFHQSNLLSLIHSISTEFPAVLLHSSSKQQQEEEEIIYVPSHLQHVFWILTLPNFFFNTDNNNDNQDNDNIENETNEQPPEPSPSSSHSQPSFQLLSSSNCHPRMIEAINALMQRFEVFLPLSVPQFDPHNVQMVSDLLNPTAPESSSFGSLTPAPPPMTPPSSLSFAPNRPRPKR